MKNGMGIIDSDAIERGLALGVNLASGCKNKKDGRVRVFSRNFPGTSKSGYALRSRIVWWIYTGEAISGIEFNIHHKNGDRSDDRIDNLEKLTHVDHAHEHNGHRYDNVPMACCVCKECGNEFKIEKSRLSEKGRGSFCSQSCYKKFPKIRKLIQMAYCFHGHELTPENSFLIKRVNGYSKGCIICRRATSVRNDKRPRKGKNSNA